MKNFVRIFALIFAVLMLSQILQGCKTEKSDGPDTTTAGTTGEVTADNGNDGAVKDDVDKKGFLKDSLPSDLNYDGKTVNILHWNVERPEFECESDGQTGDNVMDAIWARNLAIRERLGVELKFEECTGDSVTYKTFVKHVEKAVKTGEYTYDIISAYSRTAGILAQKGCYVNLNAIEDSYIDKPKPWWPEYLMDTLEVGNSLYFVSGDISPNTLHFMFGVFYNKDMLMDLGLPDPATEYVENKKWTIDRLLEMASNQYEDLNQDGKADEEDKFGLLSCFFHLDAFYTGSGLKLLEETNDGSLLRVSPDFTSHKTVDLVDKVGKWIQRNDCYCKKINTDEDRIFSAGRALFIQCSVYIADNRHPCGLNNVEWLYGLLPTPLYDENQKDYITLLGNPFGIYGVICTAPDPSMSTAVMECWASESYRRITPEIFEVNMKYKYTQEEISAKIFDILCRTRATDLGRVFGLAFANMPWLLSSTMCDGRPWTTKSKASIKALEKDVKAMVKSFIRFAER